MRLPLCDHTQKQTSTILDSSARRAEPSISKRPQASKHKEITQIQTSPRSSRTQSLAAPTESDDLCLVGSYPVYRPSCHPCSAASICSHQTRTVMHRNARTVKIGRSAANHNSQSAGVHASHEKSILETATLLPLIKCHTTKLCALRRRVVPGPAAYVEAACYVFEPIHRDSSYLRLYRISWPPRPAHAPHVLSMHMLVRTLQCTTTVNSSTYVILFASLQTASFTRLSSSPPVTRPVTNRGAPAPTARCAATPHTNTSPT